VTRIAVMSFNGMREPTLEIIGAHLPGNDQALYQTYGTVSHCHSHWMPKYQFLVGKVGASKPVTRIKWETKEDTHTSNVN